MEMGLPATETNKRKALAGWRLGEAGASAFHMVRASIRYPAQHPLSRYNNKNPAQPGTLVFFAGVGGLFSLGNPERKAAIRVSDHLVSRTLA